MVLYCLVEAYYRWWENSTENSLGGTINRSYVVALCLGVANNFERLDNMMAELSMCDCQVFGLLINCSLLIRLADDWVFIW